MPIDIEWETYIEANQTFTVELPRGWNNRVWVAATPAMKCVMANSESVGGSTSFRLGEPDLPMFVQPGATGFGVPPGMVVRPGTPAQQLLPEWVAHKYGRLPGFRITGVTDFPPLVEHAVATNLARGRQLDWVTAARLDAELTDAGKQLRAVVLMSTMGFGGFWVTEVAKLTTAEDPEPLLPALLHIVRSAAATALEQQRQAQQRMNIAAQHQSTMAMIDANTAAMTQRHQQNMANIAASAQAHQQRMANLQAGYDAHNQAWAAQQAAADAQQQAFVDSMNASPVGPEAGGSPHQDFLNTIREERTVLDAEGNAHQVQAGADKYYYRKHDDSWIGLQQHEDIADVPGIDPDDYQETTQS